MDVLGTAVLLRFDTAAARELCEHSVDRLKHSRDVGNVQFH